MNNSIVADPDQEQTPATAEANEVDEEEEGKYFLIFCLYGSWSLSKALDSCLRVLGLIEKSKLSLVL
jgi:hypothetical protein